MIFIMLAFQIFAPAAQNIKSVFVAETIDATVEIGYGIALGDVDGDEKADILLADKKQFVWYRNGDWKKFIMAENLTEKDNVCITAKDLDGDGKVEVAVGAQWNPSETKDEEKSGAVYFLVRPEDPTKLWNAVKLYHEPTTHRMRWIQSSDKSYYLIVLPLHGKENAGGEGKGVNITVFKYPELLHKKEPAYIINTNMHMTHNLEAGTDKILEKKVLYVAGKEGIGYINQAFNQHSKVTSLKMPGIQGAGEIRAGKAGDNKSFIATIEPMHGSNLVVYAGNKRQVLDSNMKEGHALITADVLGLGSDQILAGWRTPNREGKVGIKLYRKNAVKKDLWTSEWIDENDMACEDIQVMDLNGDGTLDIVASGRATHNLKIYWNRLKN